MPVIDITLLRGRTPERLRVIADAIHDALVQEFGVPVEDRFQVIHQCERHELIYDRTFVGGPRTDGFVMLRVVAGKERPVALCNDISCWSQNRRAVTVLNQSS